MTTRKFLGTILLGGSMMTGAFVACAQTPGAKAEAVEQRDHGDPAKRMQHRLDKMKSELSLTDAQTAQIKTIFEQNRAKMGARPDMEKADSAQRKAFFAQMKANREAVDAQVKAVLNPDQQAKWQKFAEKHEKRGHIQRGRTDYGEKPQGEKSTN